jgi:hypothetical protein
VRQRKQDKLARRGNSDHGGSQERASFHNQTVIHGPRQPEHLHEPGRPENGKRTRIAGIDPGAVVFQFMQWRQKVFAIRRGNTPALQRRFRLGK